MEHYRPEDIEAVKAEVRRAEEARRQERIVQAIADSCERGRRRTARKVRGGRHDT